MALTVGALICLLLLVVFSFSTTSTSSSPSASSVASKIFHPPPPEDRPLITYVFFETEDALTNLKFFLRHGLHASADFLFVVNGPASFDGFPDLPNVEVIRRPNECYDMGAYGDVFNRDNRLLVQRYKRFILMNASILGPFVPHWSKECWSDAYLSKVTEKVKLVGMTANCGFGEFKRPHIQSMIFATDRVGLEVLLDERNEHSLSSCPSSMSDAVEVEILSTNHILSAGYQVDVMQQEFQSVAHPTENYMPPCTHEDFLYDGAYYGGNISPFETLFAKTKRGIGDELLGKLREWTDTSGYSSYDYC